MKKLLRRSALLALGVFAAIQFIPYHRDHANPPVAGEPAWNAPRTRELAVRACFDCHSNETRWPWYADVAPVSWLVQRDVDEGRRALNFSEHARGERDEAGDVVAEGEMPPWFYVPLHSAARLSAAERSELAQGLVATLGGESAGEHGAERDDEKD